MVCLHLDMTIKSLIKMKEMFELKDVAIHNHDEITEKTSRSHAIGVTDRTIHFLELAHYPQKQSDKGQGQCVKPRVTRLI